MEKRFSIQINDTGETFACSIGQSLLQGMEGLGKRGIPVGCRGGGCGVCKVHILAGSYRSAKMSRACVTEAEIADGIVLACKVFPTSDLRLKVVGPMRKGLEGR